jgi:cytochrome c biogenesis protein CcmG/thiol:disulfide interchange protein DsbE
VIVSVSIRESQDVVQRFVQEQALTFLVLVDEAGAVAQQYRVRGVPTSLFIDRDGVIQSLHTGPLDTARLQTYLEQIP